MDRFYLRFSVCFLLAAPMRAETPRLVNNLKSDEDLELQKKKITTDNIIHVSSVEFHEELNGTTPGAVKVGPKKRTQKNCKIQPKTG